jgi:hypothetical protein
MNGAQPHPRKARIVLQCHWQSLEIESRPNDWDAIRSQSNAWDESVRGSKRTS